MQAPFPLFGALNVPYRIIELLHANRHRELLSASCGFDSRREQSNFATVKIEASLLFFLFYGACEHRKNIKMSNWSNEKTKQAPRTKSIQAPNGDN